MGRRQRFVRVACDARELKNFGEALLARDFWRGAACSSRATGRCKQRPSRIMQIWACQRNSLKKKLLIFALVSLSFASCALYGPPGYTPFGPNDHAFLVAQPYPREIALAKKRFQNFLRRADARQKLLLAQTPYIAVRAYTLTADEVPGLIWRMALGRIPMNDYSGADLLHNSGSVPVQFLLIFDQRTGELAAPDGVLVIGSPTRGKIARYGGFRAIYAGGGFW
jgi:hypothetical protein